MKDHLKNKVEWVDINKVKPHTKNPNKHSDEQVTRLAKIIEHNGFRHPLIVDKKSKLLVVGHGRLEAAKKLGMKEVPIHYQAFKDNDEIYQFMVADNAIHSDWAELDLSMINAELESIGPMDIELLGLKDFEVEPADKYADKDADAIPENVKTVCKTGDLWQLGEHRLLCGDCTVKENVEKLMNGKKADMVFTDPPYGIDLDTDYTKMGDAALKHKKIHGDDKEFDPKHILSLCDEIFLWGANYYCWHLPRGGSWVCWDKRSQGEERIGMMDEMFGSDFELCWSKIKHQNKLARILKPTGRYAINTDERTVHPTQKPVALVEYFINKWGKDKTNIIDLFLGSGSTLIACEKTDRRCFGCEIDPHYCDVIIKRWEDFSGKKALKLDSTKPQAKKKTKKK